MGERPLPSVIGPTENALRSLLSRVLAATPIDGYDEWVALNLVGDGGSADVAARLNLSAGAAGAILERLAAKGLVADGVLSPTGQSQLVDARAAVATATATLVAGIDAADQHTARAVLDVIRARAQAQLECA